MKSMSDDVYGAMCSRLDVLRSRMVGLLEFNLTHDECIQLVAPAAHVPMLKEVAHFADIHSSEQWMELDVPWTCDGEINAKAMLYMRTHQGKIPPLRPRDPQWQPGYACGAKVIEWLEKRLIIGRRFGLAYKVLSELSGLCDTGAQIRYLWPVVMHLTKGTTNERTMKWAERNSAYKAQRHVPAIGAGLREAIRDSSALLTSCALIGEDLPEPVRGPVAIDIWKLPPFDFHGERVFRK